MTKAPWFKFYPKDFAADSAVESMSTVAVGAYILLLCKAWHEEIPGTLPDDDRRLSRWARLSTEEWQSVKDEVLAAFVKDSDGRWLQKRMTAEYSRVSDASERAKHAARSRWGTKDRSIFHFFLALAHLGG